MEVYSTIGVHEHFITANIVILHHSLAQSFTFTYDSVRVWVGLSLKPCRPFNATLACSTLWNSTQALPTSLCVNDACSNPENCSKRIRSIVSVVVAGRPWTWRVRLPLDWAPLVMGAMFDSTPSAFLCAAFSFAWLSVFLIKRASVGRSTVSPLRCRSVSEAWSACDRRWMVCYTF